MNIYSTDDIARRHIHNSLIPRLAMLNDRGERTERLYGEFVDLFKGGYSYDLHEALRPFYAKYMQADAEFFSSAHTNSRMMVRDLMETDPHFGHWLGESDLPTDVQRWAGAAHESVSMPMFHVMRCAIQGGYENDWDGLAENFRTQLFEEAEFGTPWSREAYAVMHAVSAIYSAPMNEAKKTELFELLRDEWDFLKYIYSVMFRCVFGCKLKNLIQVANVIHNQATYHSYAHLFYAVFAERADDLCKSKADEKKVEKHLGKLLEVMETTPSSDKLDGLCDLLFPNELRQYLDRHRPKDTRQLREEINQLRKALAETNRQMSLQIQETATKMAALVETSVPVVDIEAELMNLPDGMAWDIFGKLNTLLMANVAWTKNAVGIRNRLLKRMQTPTPMVQATNYYASGATHDDRSQHLSVESGATIDHKMIGQA